MQPTPRLVDTGEPRPSLVLIERPTPQRTPTLNRLHAMGCPILVAYVHGDVAEQGWGDLDLQHPHVFFDQTSPIDHMRMVASVARHRYSWLVAMGYRGFGRTASLLAAKVTRVPVATRSDTNQLQVEVQPRRRRRVRRLVWRALLPREATAWTIGEQNEAFWTQEIGLRNTIRIPYEVPVLPGFRDGSAYERVRQSDPEQLTFLYVGRLTAIKRVDDLIAAFSALTEPSTAGWRLRIVGSGDAHSSLAGLAATDPRIEFVGPLDYSALGYEFETADVLVLPSLGEPWGLVVNEALGFGLRVIASDQVGAAYDLLKPETGESYPVGDVLRLTQLLRNCGEHLEQRSRSAQTDTALLMAEALGYKPSAPSVGLL